MISLNLSTYISTAALKAVSANWPKTTELHRWIKDRVKNDDNYDVRRTAVQELAKSWKNDRSLFEFWCDRAVNDPFEREENRQENPRQIALEVLLRVYPDSFETARIIRGRIERDSDPKVQKLAIKALFKDRQKDQTIIEYLRSLTNPEIDYQRRGTIIEEVAKVWKSNEAGLNWLLSFTASPDWVCRESAANSLARFWGTKPEVTSKLKEMTFEDSHWIVRVGALDAWADKVPKDADLVSSLKQLIQYDANWLVRAGAAQLLASNCKDDASVIQWLSETVLTSDGLTLEDLEKDDFPESPAAIDWLKSHIHHEPDPIVRAKLIEGIASKCKDNSELFDLLCQRTKSDPFVRKYDWEENPRQSSLQGLVDQHSDHPKTHELLIDRAQNDCDEHFRDWSQKQLDQLSVVG